MKRGWYCEDCDIIITEENKGEHDYSHTLTQIYWNFTSRMIIEKENRDE